MTLASSPPVLSSHPEAYRVTPKNRPVTTLYATGFEKLVKLLQVVPVDREQIFCAFWDWDT